MANGPVDKPAPQQGDEFEFNDAHNLVFDGLAKLMKVVGIIQIALAVLYAIPAVLALTVLNTPPVVIAALHIIVVVLMGVWTIRAGGHVRAIVSTEGDDVRHLMEAMVGLKKLFVLQAVVFVVLAALTVAGFLTAGLSGAPRMP